MQKKRRQRNQLLHRTKREKWQGFRHKESAGLASGMKKIAAATLKKQELVVKRDIKREEMYLAFRCEEAEKNRENELRTAELHATMFSKET